MDYKKVYSPTEATALYNVAKIKFDPTSYSLKGNLITSCNTSQLRNEHICGFNYDAERYLYNIIDNKEGKVLKSLTGPSDERDSRRFPNFTSWAYLGVQQDNLYVNLELLEPFIDLRRIKTTNVMQTIVTMFVALNSQKSCAKDMLWLVFGNSERISYSDVHTFEPLKRSLKSKSKTLNIYFSGTTIDPTYVPANDPEGPDFAIAWKAQAADSLYAHIISSFEVLWAWSKLNEEYKTCFETLCNTAQFKGRYDTALFNSYFTLTDTGFMLSEELQDAIAIDEPEKRYSAYQDIVLKDKVTLMKRCEDYFTNDIQKGTHYLNSLIAAYTSFVMQLSVTNIRVNTIRILHEYCVAQKYLNPEDAEPESPESVSAKFGAAFGATLTTGPSKDKSKSLVDFEKPKYSSGVAPKRDEDDDGDHDSSAMFEALDKVKASFSSGKYSFDVEDVKDTDDDSKAKYNAIAAKVDMVNKLLIRRIRDIKTYNVGGKNSGASSGRLDRKAIHRYKYDPNIFYNNTYKTLESDLAFGIVLDESGSMSGSGIKNGRTTMLVLHETLKALGINHCIVGHTSHGRYHSQIARYQSFREDKTYKVCKNYALVKTEAKAGNCDSGALYYMEKALDRVRNKDKICLIFSDGAPTECTGTELKNQVKAMEKKGIKVIGIGINFESIAKYYTDYANGRNLADMLNIVAKILEEYVLKKKDK
jgi:hypothetical protein